MFGPVGGCRERKSCPRIRSDGVGHGGRGMGGDILMLNGVYRDSTCSALRYVVLVQDMENGFPNVGGADGRAGVIAVRNGLSHRDAEESSQ